LEVFVNGHPTDVWSLPQVTLPPNGWYVKNAEAQSLLAFSALQNGRRVDYVDSPAYVYANGRGQLTRFPAAVARGQLVARRLDVDHMELLAYGSDPVLGVAMDGRAATAMALDEAGHDLRPAETRFSRGMVFVTPVPNAVSYRLTAGTVPERPLSCARLSVVPGETVRLEPDGVEWRVPADAAIGEQIWHQSGGRWIDFMVVPLATSHLALKAGQLELGLVAHTSESTAAVVQLDTMSREVTLIPGKVVTLLFPKEAPTTEMVQEVPLSISAGALRFSRSWWIKAETETQVIADYPSGFQAGERLRSGSEASLDGRSLAIVHWTSRACGNEQRKCLFIHPPYHGGTGYAYALSDPVALPVEPATALRCDIGKADGSDPGDGIVFRVAVVDATGQETLLEERTWQTHAWTSLETDLARWAGQTIRVKLSCDVGPADNSSGDWGCWSQLRLESREPVLVTTLHSQKPELLRAPGPFPAGELTLGQVRAARRAQLHFRGAGLQCGEPYVSTGRLNGESIGALPAAPGQEASGEWSDAVVELPATVVARLDEWNEFTLQNPGRDSFKVGRFWLELELADGRKVSSDVTTTVYTQPESWPYGEGQRVPFGSDIRTTIRIRGWREPR
jgi:hypothetical protein